MSSLKVDGNKMVGAVQSHGIPAFLGSLLIEIY